MQREELLTKRKIFQDEVPARTQGADNPADEVPEHKNMAEILSKGPATKQIPSRSF